MGGGIIVGDEYQSNCDVKKNIKAGIPLAMCLSLEPETNGLVIKLPADSALITRDLALSVFYSVGNVLVWNFDDKRSEHLNQLNAGFTLDLINQGITEHVRNPDLDDMASMAVTVAIFANAIDSLTCSEKTAQDMREKFKNTALIVDTMRDWLDQEGEISAAAKTDDDNKFSLAGSSSGSSRRSSGPLIGPYRSEVLSKAGQSYIPAYQSSRSRNVVPQVAALQRLATGGPNYSSKQYSSDSKTALQLFPPPVVQQAQWQGSRPSVPSNKAIKNAANFSKNAIALTDFVAYNPWSQGSGMLPEQVHERLKVWDYGTKGALLAGAENRIVDSTGTVKSFIAPFTKGPLGVPSVIMALPNMHLQGLADPNNPIMKGINTQKTQRAKRAAIPLTNEQKQSILSGALPVDRSGRAIESESVLRYILSNPDLPYKKDF